MSQELINRSSDLKKLQDEGYELEVNGSHAIVYHVPYLNARGDIKTDGILVSPLALQGNQATYKQDGNHVIHFKGEMPCELDGKQITSIFHANTSQSMAGVQCSFSFSNKPATGYKDYYEKFTRYIEIISSPARAKSDRVTAHTYHRIVSSNNSVFVYEDTNASRAGISSISDKLKEQKIGIIGLGGSGSYILDLIAKTPVSEIHLFDGDAFCQHNSFRAPGAAHISAFSKEKNKARYFKSVYSRMHRGIKSHAVFLNKSNCRLLKSLDFVFICVDSGTAKREIIAALTKYAIKFIDTGIGLELCANALLGSVRNTTILNGADSRQLNTISFTDNTDDLYATNIQTADLNCLCATLAVIRWKKLCGFYQDLNPKEYSVYTTNDGELLYED